MTTLAEIRELLEERFHSTLPPNTYFIKLFRDNTHIIVNLFNINMDMWVQLNSDFQRYNLVVDSMEQTTEDGIFKMRVLLKQGEENAPTLLEKPIPTKVYNIVIKNSTNLPNKVYKYVDNGGLFNEAIELFIQEPLEKQIEIVKGLPFVSGVVASGGHSNIKIKFDFANGKKTSMRKGKYEALIVKKATKVYIKRTDTPYFTYANPFISGARTTEKGSLGYHFLCGGNIEKNLQDAKTQGNIVDVAYLISEVLCCKDSSRGYRRWSACYSLKQKKNEKKTIENKN